MPRLATGSIVRDPRGLPIAVRLQVVGVGRKRVPLPLQCSEEMAEQKRQVWSADARAGKLELSAEASDAAKDAGEIPSRGPRGETVHGYVGRLFTEREKRNVRGLRQEQSRYNHHLKTLLGRLPVAHVTRVDMEGLVEKLDASVRAGTFSWRTAGHVWSFCTMMFGEAQSSKARALRVRDDNPTTGVRGPDRGQKKKKISLYPSEFLALMNCPRVPVRWARLIALSVYLYPRPGELAVLEWPAVDLEHGIVLVHSAEGEGGEAGKTKTGDTRRVPIEPMLVPLLKEMHAEADGKGRVVGNMPPESDLSKRLRKYLGWAGVKRAELFVGAKHRAMKQMTWYDLRATGITWRVVRGDPLAKIKSGAGHRNLSTTEGYVREVEGLDTAFGDVFPPLPLRQLASESASDDADTTETTETLAETERPQRDSNPR